MSIKIVTGSISESSSGARVVTPLVRWHLPMRIKYFYYK